MHQLDPHTESTTTLDRDLSNAVTIGIRTPLAALRASMESLAHGLEDADPRAGTLQGALDEVIRLGRNVQALLDYTLPAPLHPLACTIDEIAHAALDALPREQRPRVLLAIESGSGRVQLDGPLLARALAHLIEGALEASAEPVLLCVRHQHGSARFTILHDTRGGMHADRATGAAHTTNLGLGLSIARRDVERMGGAITERRTSKHACTSEVCFELKTTEGPRS